MSDTEKLSGQVSENVKILPAIADSSHQGGSARKNGIRSWNFHLIPAKVVFVCCLK